MEAAGIRTWESDPLPLTIKPIVCTMVEYLAPVIERLELRLHAMELQLQQLEHRMSVLVESHKTMNEVQQHLLAAFAQS